jgi:hypothetical protein
MNGPRPALAASTRQRHIQALQRRAAQHQGAVRQLLNARLQALQADEDAAAQPVPPSPPSPSPSPLAELLAHIAHHNGAPSAPAGPAGPGARTPEAPHSRQAPRELKAVRDYRSTWSRLSVQQRVQQALARVPDNAGPLNTQRLVHQLLHALHAASPPYLHRLVTQVEALLWLEQVAQGGAAPRPEGRRAAR